MQPKAYLSVNRGCNNMQKRIAMKKWAFLSLLMVLTVPLWSQDDDPNEFKTIFQGSGDDISISGFGGPMMSFTSIGESFAHMMGGGGGILINNFFFVFKSEFCIITACLYFKI